MANCSNCGAEIDESSVFCQNCGSKVSGDIKGNVQSRPIVQNTTSFEDKKTLAMIGFGYLTLFIQIVAILASWSNVKVINADRVILYPLLCVILSYFVAFNLVKEEKTFIHGIIVAAISVILFILGIIAI